MPRRAQEAALRRAETGELKLLYLAPERLDSPSFRRSLPSLPVRLLAVDEAHCISQWGHDFRPAYLKLSRVHELAGRVPVMALTATATPRVREDIVRVLGLIDPVETVAGFDRPNLFFRHEQVYGRADRDHYLLDLLENAGGAAVVYCASVKNVDRVAGLLTANGFRAAGYHAKLNSEARTRVQDAFMAGEFPIVVATNAFGMGVDKPDVRTVVHYDMPGSVEAYYQEAGRAGRDGRPADCVLLADADYDCEIHEFFIGCKHPVPAHVDALLKAARARGALSPATSMPVDELVDAAAATDKAEFIRGAWDRLQENGIFAGGKRPALLWARLLVDNETLRGQPEGELTVLRQLYSKGGREAMRGPMGAVVEWEAIGGPRAEGAMRRAERAGWVTWKDLRPLTWLQTPRVSTPDALPWEEIARSRNAQEDLLEGMRSYVLTGECRRKYLLRYFGDPDADMVECGGCDRCEAVAPWRPATPLAPPRRDFVPTVTYPFAVNDWIRHPELGDGCILAFGGDEALVRFPTGAKRIKITHPGLTRLSGGTPADVPGG
jgi:ATP-dependent DNA helicase RecQ